MTDEPKDKTVQFIAKLVQLTQDKRLRWESTQYPSFENDSIPGAAYTAALEGKSIRIYKAKREVLVQDKDANVFFSTSGSVRRKSISTAILEVLDDFGQATFTFDRTTGLNDLYESAAFSASRVDDLMDSVLRRK